ATNASKMTGPILSILPFAQSSAWAKHRRLALKFSSFAKQFKLRLIGTKFGIRFELFHRFLLEDSKFGFVALALVFLIAWIYSGSLAFSGFSLIGIVFSLGKKQYIPGLILQIGSYMLDFSFRRFLFCISFGVWHQIFSVYKFANWSTADRHRSR